MIASGWSRLVACPFPARALSSVSAKNSRIQSLARGARASVLLSCRPSADRVSSSLREGTDALRALDRDALCRGSSSRRRIPLRDRRRERWRATRHVVHVGALRAAGVMTDEIRHGDVRRSRLSIARTCESPGRHAVRVGKRRECKSTVRVSAPRAPKSKGEAHADGSPVGRCSAWRNFGYAWSAASCHCDRV